MIGKTTFKQLGDLGRLGNQMHQISAIAAYAKKHNKQLVLPEWRYNKYLKNPFPTNNDNNVVINHNYI